MEDGCERIREKDGWLNEERETKKREGGIRGMDGESRVRVMVYSRKS